MVIKASSSRQVASLVAELGSPNDVTREAAIARLTVLGAPALDRLSAILDSDASTAARVAALRTLEAIADPRAVGPLLAAFDAGEPEVASAAVLAVRPFLRGARGATIVDRLTSAAMQIKRDETVRVAALRALRELDNSTIAPLLEALRSDPSAAVRAEARMKGPGHPPADVLARAAAGTLPDDPEELGKAIELAGGGVSLPALLQIIERLRGMEASEPASRRAHWTRARGRAHLALAERRSRIGLYDLRESLDGATKPFPVDFLAALSKVGDLSCLEPLAAAYVRAGSGRRGGEGDARDWWHEHLAEVFRTIVAKEALTRRHAVMKRIDKRWPGALDDLLA